MQSFSIPALPDIRSPARRRGTAQAPEIPAADSIFGKNRYICTVWQQKRDSQSRFRAATKVGRHFMKWGKSFVVTSNLYSTNRMFRCSHCATGCRYTGRHLPTVQKFKMRKAGQRPFVSVMARLRGSCKLKPRQEQKPAPLSNAWQISASIWPRWRWNRKKAVSILNNSSNLIR